MTKQEGGPGAQWHGGGTGGCGGGRVKPRRGIYQREGLAINKKVQKKDTRIVKVGGYWRYVKDQVEKSTPTGDQLGNKVGGPWKNRRWRGSWGNE